MDGESINEISGGVPSLHPPFPIESLWLWRLPTWPHQTESPGNWENSSFPGAFIWCGQVVSLWGDLYAAVPEHDNQLQKCEHGLSLVLLGKDPELDYIRCLLILHSTKIHFNKRFHPQITPVSRMTLGMLSFSAPFFRHCCYSLSTLFWPIWFGCHRWMLRALP